MHSLLEDDDLIFVSMERADPDVRIVDKVKSEPATQEDKETSETADVVSCIKCTQYKISV